MPDWTYHTIFKPVLFRVESRKARDIMLSATGTLGSMPFGRQVLAFMGHMKPHDSLATELLGCRFPCPVGLGGGLTSDANSILAFSEFGFGFIEVGPVTVLPVAPGDLGIKRDTTSETISYKNVPENPGVHVLEKSLTSVTGTVGGSAENTKSRVRLGIRISNMPGSSFEDAVKQYETLASKLSRFANFLVIDTRWWNSDWDESEIRILVETIKRNCNDGAPPAILLLVPPECPESRCDLFGNLAISSFVSGLVVGGGLNNSVSNHSNQSSDRNDNDWICFGRSTKQVSLEKIRYLRNAAPDTVLIGSGGIIEPQDALDFFGAGANLVQLHSGLVFAGPGLPKRINEAISFVNPTAETASPYCEHDIIRSLNQGWFSFAIVSIGLIIAAVTVICVGMTSVLLPYDESFLGVNTKHIPDINAHLLEFMRHDRVTLGGSSLSGAVLFLLLAVFGVRGKHHWAYVAEVAGITAGFLAFFLYLGFKYFDPLHALVCLLVLPFFLWAVYKRPRFVPERSANFHNDAAWKRSQLGQLMFVMIGAGLLLAGITIAFVGCSTIFVKEDLMYMETSRDVLANVNHLLPLIAHDRASFGGCLWAVGTVEMLISMYGFRQGNRWVWWTLLIGGLPGFICVLGIHYCIGYTSFVHLLPAYIAFCMYVVGLFCSFEYLHRKP